MRNHCAAMRLCGGVRVSAIYLLISFDVTGLGVHLHRLLRAPEMCPRCHLGEFYNQRRSHQIAQLINLADGWPDNHCTRSAQILPKRSSRCVECCHQAALKTSVARHQFRDANLKFVSSHKLYLGNLTMISTFWNWPKRWDFHQAKNFHTISL